MKACISLQAGGIALKETWVRLSAVCVHPIVGALSVVWFIAE